MMKNKDIYANGKYPEMFPESLVHQFGGKISREATYQKPDGTMVSMFQENDCMWKTHTGKFYLVSEIWDWIEQTAFKNETSCDGKPYHTSTGHFSGWSEVAIDAFRHKWL